MHIAHALIFTKINAMNVFLSDKEQKTTTGLD